MKPNFALDLSHEGINLLHRSKGGWTLVGSVALDDPDMPAHLEELRRSAAMLESGGFTTKLIIPDSQILYTTVAAPGPDDISREVQIRAALDGLTPYPVGELTFDWRAQGNEARVAVLARETMDEAEGFAADYRFNPVSFVARPKRGEFSGEPFFGKTKAASRLLSPGERIEPDASPVPVNPKAKELPAEARIDLPPVPDDSGEDEPPVLSDPAPDTPETDDPFAELDTLAARISEGSDPAKPASPPATKPRRKKSRGDAGQPVAAPTLAPFPPTLDEDSDTPRPFLPQPEARSKPVKPARAEPVRPTTTSDEQDDSDHSSAPSSAAPEPAPAEPAPAPTPPVSFASRRAPPAAPKSSDAPGQTTETMPKSGDADAEPAQDGATAAAPKAYPAPLRDPGLPPLAHDRIRSDMAAALSKPLPSPDKQREPEKSGPGLLSRLTGRAAAVAERSSTARRDRATARTKAAEAKAAAAATKSGTAAKAEPQQPASTAKTKPEAPSRKGFLGFGHGPASDDLRRSREAEALTVFGARRSQSTSSRPKYLGLILTLVLLLVMAAVALWSSFLVDDGEVSLFNPSPEIATGGADTAPEAAPQTGAASEDDSSPSSAEVLSPEAAEARYAATGIWQRAPDVPGVPETTHLDGLDLADLAPGIASREAAPLPDESSGGLREAALADPVPPPPPGTTFDLDANGLVVATPEGALSPTGILVYSGRPAAVPPAPPAGIFPSAPEAAPDDAAAEGAALAAPVTEDIVADATEAVAAPEIPGIRPPTRPADLVPAAAPAPAEPEDNAALVAEAAPAADTAAIDAAIEDVIQAALVNPTELAVAASTVPSRRPSNFATIVDSARASASDGSTVVAAVASETVAPAIPTSASVATRATTENALNLRDINLIGIYGSSNARRALVRLKTGRYVKVEVGDRLDGGQVTSISASRLTYQKGSRSYALDVLPLG
jgi:hypothetical protein